MSMHANKVRLFVTLAVFGVAGCSSKSNSPAPGVDVTTPSADTGTDLCKKNDLQIFFAPMYTAFDGVHEFKIPAIVANVDPASVMWSASDTSMVGLQNDDGVGGVMIQALKAGKVIIVASSGGLCGVSTLTISSATPDDWEVGNQRYNNGVVLTGTVGGGRNGRGGGGGAADAGPPMTTVACTNCHGVTATAGQYRTVAHTPEQTGGFSDDDLINIFTKGMVPIGGYFDDSFINYNTWHGFHQWTMTPEESKGVIVYLRSLAPLAQTGMRGNFGRGGDGGMRGGNGNGNGGTGDGGAPTTTPTPDAATSTPTPDAAVTAPADAATD